MTNELEETGQFFERTTQSAAVLNQQNEELNEGYAKLTAEQKKFAHSLERDLTGAMRRVAIEGGSLKESLKSIALSLADKGFNAALTPVMSEISAGAVGLLPFADGGVIARGRVQAFANGGVVNSPMFFPMQGGTGLMGEAGAEAIMPLARGSDGRLGLQASGNKTTNVTVNISSPDAGSFHKSKGQIAAQLHRAISQADK